MSIQQKAIFMAARCKIIVPEERNGIDAIGDPLIDSQISCTVEHLLEYVRKQFPNPGESNIDGFVRFVFNESFFETNRAIIREVNLKCGIDNCDRIFAHNEPRTQAIHPLVRSLVLSTPSETFKSVWRIGRSVHILGYNKVVFHDEFVSHLRNPALFYHTLYEMDILSDLVFSGANIVEWPCNTHSRKDVDALIEIERKRFIVEFKSLHKGDSVKCVEEMIREFISSFFSLSVNRSFRELSSPTFRLRMI
ncbi:MAG: hypothetical protein HQM01_11005 [Magnetococcales bacterium]|nr:hypothetical protein [Magnetococcales bacterium]